MAEHRINKVHFIGIGGVGMSGIARVAKEKGMEVSGSDLRESRYTQQLREAGVNIAERCVAPRVQRLYRRIDAAELFSGGETGLGIAAVRLERRHIGQAADTDHEKFIQIARVNGGKLQLLANRDRLVLRKVQDAPVEFKPAQLPVDEYLPRMRLFHKKLSFK